MHALCRINIWPLVVNFGTENFKNIYWTSCLLICQILTEWSKIRFDVVLKLCFSNIRNWHCYSPRKSVGVCSYRIGLCVCLWPLTKKIVDGFAPNLCLCVCLWPLTKKIVDGFAPNFMGMFLGGKEDQVHDSLWSVEGCGSNGQKNSLKCKQWLVYSSSLIVGEASVGDKTAKFRFRRELYSQSTFHLVPKCDVFTIWCCDRLVYDML